uniref:Uncharacterized protein n=1 Tax=Manihot esculenta TaxID=3983 RepID=A0A2C9URJ2_MANES
MNLSASWEANFSVQHMPCHSPHHLLFNLFPASVSSRFLLASKSLLVWSCFASSLNSGGVMKAPG